MKSFALLTAVLLTINCSTVKNYETIGSIERLDPALDEIIKKDAVVEKIADGYDWSEGPLWVESHKMLLFSDVPKNTIYKWTEAKGAEVYLTPSGYTGSTPSLSREPGSNGLTLDKQNRLVMCQHGDRRIARMDAPLDKPAPKFITIADKYDGKKFNSPNDVIVASNGDVYFTDPPYGLPQNVNDPTKETPYQGIYKATTDGKVILLVDSITRPNGIALTPEEKTLIVANSDPMKPNWYAFDLGKNNTVSNARIFYSAKGVRGMGLCDGFKIDKKGNLFASGPGGIWIFNKDAKLLGKIKLPNATSNCALADNDKTLYMTSDAFILRLKMQ